MTAGIDLGSRTVKILRLGPRGRLQADCFDTVPFYRRYARRHAETGRLELALDALRLAPDARIVSTGYGRNLCAFANAEVMPEIEAHVAGALALVEARSFVLVDVGGQDTKVAVVERGRLVSFEMNDRCAAGTGRFLETIARTLDMPIEALARCEDDPIPISATCAIFSESEVVGRLVEGSAPERLAAGANLSVARRLAAMLARVPRKRTFATGGGARNPAVVALLAREIARPVTALPGAQFAGALGCLVRACKAAGCQLPANVDWRSVSGLGTGSRGVPTPPPARSRGAG